MTTTFLFSTWDRWKFIKVDSWDLPNTPIGLLFSLNACSITWLSRNQSFSTPFKFALWPIQLFSLSAHFTRAHTVRPQHRATVCCVLINPVSGATALNLSLFKDFYCRTQTVTSHILQNSAHSDIRSHASCERGSWICECNLQSQWQFHWSIACFHITHRPTNKYSCCENFVVNSYESVLTDLSQRTQKCTRTYKIFEQQGTK